MIIKFSQNMQWKYPRIFRVLDTINKLLQIYYRLKGIILTPEEIGQESMIGSDNFLRFKYVDYLNLENLANQERGAIKMRNFYVSLKHWTLGLIAIIHLRKANEKTELGKLCRT